MKPPITENLPHFRVTDEEIQALIKARHLDEKGMSLAEQRMTAMTIKLITGVATAQRDADAAWFREEIEKLENPHIAESARIGFESCRQKILKTLEGK